MPEELRKSEGHVAFIGPFEYFTDDAGELYRADTSWPVMPDGRRWGRWEAPPHLLASTLEIARAAFDNPTPLSPTDTLG